MITVFAAISAVYFLLDAGACGRRWADERPGATGIDVLIPLVLGLFGIYALIVGK